MTNCEICGRRLGFGDESKGEPFVDLRQCPRSGCFECLAIADVKCEYERQIAHLKELAQDGSRAYMKAKEADDAYMRSLGLSHTAIYRVMSEHENAQISFGRLVELVRTAARRMAEEEMRKQTEEALNLLREAHRELNTIEAITVSPTPVDGLLDLVHRMADLLVQRGMLTIDKPRTEEERRQGVRSGRLV